MFDLMIQQAQGVATAGLSRGELAGVVGDAGRCGSGQDSFTAAGQRNRHYKHYCMVSVYVVSHPLARLWSCSI